MSEEQDYVQLNFNVAKDLKLRFHKICLDKGLTMHEVLNACIESFVKGQIEFE